MIGKVSRGWRAGGLVRYLLGPGRFNEHRDPHVVATWHTRPDLAEPVEDCRDPDRPDAVTDLITQLTAPQVAAGIADRALPPRPGQKTPPKGPVWHCSLRHHPDDPTLTDAQWLRVVLDVLDRTGIAPRGDPFACRWALIRHADDHVHLAAVLVRQDTGRRFHPVFDHRAVREVCRETETRLGLTPTGDADGTAPCHPSRAEQQKAERAHLDPSRPVDEQRASRVVLRDAARRAALHARTDEDFLAHLDARGLRTRIRRGPDGRITGYALARLGDTDRHGAPVWYSGARLARDLSLPRLATQWASAPPPPTPIAPAPHERSRTGRDERAAAVHDAAEAARDALDDLRRPDGENATKNHRADDAEPAAAHDTTRVHDGAPADTDVHPESSSEQAGSEEPPRPGGTVHDLDDARRRRQHSERIERVDAVAHSLRDLLVALNLTARDAYPDLTAAADQLDRTARTPRRVLPQTVSPEARAIRTAAWRLATITTLPNRGPERAPLAELVLAVALLVAELAKHRAAQNRAAQASAARDAARTLATAVGHDPWSPSADGRPSPSAPSRGQRARRSAPSEHDGQQATTPYPLPTHGHRSSPPPAQPSQRR